jgi:hypothetical protein
MNWGYKILLVIIAFIVGMLSMVYIASKQTNEMIDKDYYEKELKYQDLINAAQNLNNLNINKDSILFAENKILKIKLPTNTFENFKSGNLELLRLDDIKKDKNIILNPIHGNQDINMNELFTGNYKIRLFWENASKSYYIEKMFFIQK